VIWLCPAYAVCVLDQGRAWPEGSGQFAELRRVAVIMTQQYIVGELSLLLAGLQAVAPDQTSARSAARLRDQAEHRPVTELGSLVWCALDLADALCRASLDRGDAEAFAAQAAIGAELSEFAVCAGLLDDERGDERWSGT